MPSAAYWSYMNSLPKTPWQGDTGGDTIWTYFDPFKAQAAGLTPREVFDMAATAKAGGGNSATPGLEWTGSLQPWLESLPPATQQDLHDYWLAGHGDSGWGAFFGALAIAAAPLALATATGSLSWSEVGSAVAPSSGAVEAAAPTVTQAATGAASTTGTSAADVAAASDASASTAGATAAEDAFAGMNVPSAGTIASTIGTAGTLATKASSFLSTIFGGGGSGSQGSGLTPSAQPAQTNKAIVYGAAALLLLAVVMPHKK